MGSDDNFDFTSAGGNYYQIGRKAHKPLELPSVDWRVRWREERDRAEKAEAERDAALTALKALVDLNDNGGPFGGEIYRDRVENAWFNARAAIRALTLPKDKP